MIEFVVVGLRCWEELNLVVVENLCFEKIAFKQFHNLFTCHENECIRCVRAPGHAFDHFLWMGDLTLRFLAKMAKTRGRNTRKRALSRRCAWGTALAAHFQKVGAWGRAVSAHSHRASARRCTLVPGAQDRTTGTLFRVRVLGGSRVRVWCDRFEVFFCCFHSLFYWNTIGFVET